ncbi:hypothetical protein KSF73_07755 [Burkholderiaceae bacterium DAT-1]|nr:hypothetical protein [Burkholderiaceae bacterium DAT-1]
MGMHYGFVAVTATAEEFEQVFSEIWPALERINTAILPSLEAYFAWKASNERFVPSKDWTPENTGAEVYGFLQDGKWSVLLDHSYVLSSDSDALIKLSDLFGTCITFILETSGGTTSFAFYRQGKLIRQIDNCDGEISLEGVQLPEEIGLQIQQFYIEEAIELQKRLGFRFLSDVPPNTIIAIATIDRTDYSSVLQQQEVQVAPNSRCKPWWKFW